MKKNLFLLGLAVAAMTSCTNDEVVEMKQPTQNAIGFETFVNKGTRNVLQETTTLTTFNVFGYYGQSPTIVFNNDNVFWDGSKWTYDDANTDLQYWKGNTTYNFAAYANGNSTAALNDGAIASFADGVLEIAGYQVDNSNDLVAALATKTVGADPTGTTTVDFTFQHLLTKVKFTVKNMEPNYTVKISGITFSAYNTGTCYYNGTPRWTPSGNLVDFNLLGQTNLAEKDKNGSSATSEELFLFSQDLANVKLNMTATFYNENNEVVDILYFTDVPLDTKYDGSAIETATWSAGYAYNYIIGLPSSETPIIFGAPEVGDWEEYTPVTLN